MHSLDAWRISSVVLRDVPVCLVKKILVLHLVFHVEDMTQGPLDFALTGLSIFWVSW